MKYESSVSLWMEEQGMEDRVSAIQDGRAYLVSEQMKTFKEQRRNGELVVPVIMGPTASGKDALVDCLNTDRFERVRTFTTRPRERGESEENDAYIRGTKDDYDQLIAEGKFLEHAENNGNYYGMIRDVVEQTLDIGKIPVFRVDLQGVRTLKDLKAKGEPLFAKMNFWVIFVCPPEKYEWMRRLIGRDVISQLGEDRVKMRAKAKKRWAEAKVALGWMSEANEIIINENGEANLKHVADSVEWIIELWNS